MSSRDDILNVHKLFEQNNVESGDPAENFDKTHFNGHLMVYRNFSQYFKVFFIY